MASEIVQTIKADLESRVEAALAEISELEGEAEERERRYHSAVEELQSTREELASSRKEHGSLPLAEYEQNMRGDALKEEELRGRYLELEERIPELERRSEGLAAECDQLCSGSARALPASGVFLQQHRAAVSTAKARREELETIRDALSEVVDEAIQPLIERHQRMLNQANSESGRAMEAVKAAGYASASSIPGH